MSAQSPTVVLLAGASGTGKTRLSYPLAARLGAALVEVDDLVVAVQALTDATTHPALHYWLRHGDAGLSPEQVADRQIEFAAALQPALEAVIANHLETGTPVVIEGDYVVPGGAGSPDVRTALIVEDDVDQLVANYRAREPAAGDQRARAEASLAYGARLADRARAGGVPVVAARPWSDALDRLVAALGLSGRIGTSGP
jgi:2-phosphoglycerate kinase